LHLTQAVAARADRDLSAVSTRATETMQQFSVITQKAKLTITMILSN